MRSSGSVCATGRFPTAGDQAAGSAEEATQKPPPRRGKISVGKPPVETEGHVQSLIEAVALDALTEGVRHLRSRFPPRIGIFKTVTYSSHYQLLGFTRMRYSGVTATPPATRDRTQRRQRRRGW